MLLHFAYFSLDIDWFLALTSLLLPELGLDLAILKRSAHLLEGAAAGSSGWRAGGGGG